MPQDPRRVAAHTDSHSNVPVLYWMVSLPTNSQVEVLIPSTSKYDLI